MEYLLPAVYAKSIDLWHVLRDTSRHVASALSHFAHEGDIERDGTLNAATKLMSDWASTEAQLEQARNLLGTDEWDSLASKADARRVGR